jgi:hypothetical protein
MEEGMKKKTVTGEPALPTRTQASTDKFLDDSGVENVNPSVA